MKVVYFGWVDSPVEVQPGLELPQFSLVGTVLNDCSTNYTTGRTSTLCHAYIRTVRLPSLIYTRLL